jgi:hypothetical protein
MFKKGDILLPESRIKRKNWLNGLYHPAVVWQDTYDGNGDFSGIMLTSSEPNGIFDNVLMAENHFEIGYEITFSNSHFVNHVFIKFEGWGPFELVGRLTSEGIAFIENHLKMNSIIAFTEYRDAAIK